MFIITLIQKIYVSFSSIPIFLVKKIIVETLRNEQFRVLSKSEFWNYWIDLISAKCNVQVGWFLPAKTLASYEVSKYENIHKRAYISPISVHNQPRLRISSVDRSNERKLLYSKKGQKTNYTLPKLLRM